MSQQPENESISFLLSLICKAQRSQVNDALTGIGLYAGQDMFLWQLSQHDGLTQSQMVERMCVQPPTVSKMLDRMEKAGLVTRRADPDDNRVSRLYLTEQGRDAEQTVRQVWHSMELRIIDSLSVQEQVLLRRLLLQVYENLTETP